MFPALVGGFFTIEPRGESHKVNTKAKRQYSSLMHEAGYLSQLSGTTHRDGVGGGAVGSGEVSGWGTLGHL